MKELVRHDVGRLRDRIAVWLPWGSMRVAVVDVLRLIHAGMEVRREAAEGG